MTACSRCHDGTPATTHLEYRESGDRDHWQNRTTDRCDRCAQALREHADWTTQSPLRTTVTIVVDAPLERGEELRIEAFEMALGRFLDERAGDAADIEWNVKADGGDEWEVQLWLNGDDAGYWKITPTSHERITA